LMSDNMTVVLPIVFPALYQNSKSHWNRCAQFLSRPRVVSYQVIQYNTWHGV
jgi:hypothetical protein